jgi:hypothetical protein
MISARRGRILAAVLILALCLWAPWLSPDFASRRAVQSFNAQWQGVVDGCGFHCTGCGPAQTAWVPFGRTVQLVYACGMLPADSPEYHQTKSVFVSFFGAVW